MILINKKSKVITGTTLILLSGTLIAAATLNVLKPVQPADIEAAKSTLITECKKYINSYNFETTNKNGILEVNSYGLENWDSDIAKFSIIMTNCNGFGVKSFCMGNSCKAPGDKSISGTTMTLEYNGQLKNIVR